MGGLAFVLCVLAQASLSSAIFSGHFEYEVTVSLPPLPSLPQISLPQLSLPKLPGFSLPGLPGLSLPPLPSRVTIPGFTVPGFSIPPQEPLKGLHLPPFPQPTVTLPRFPGLNLPATTILPPLPSLRFPGISIPPLPEQTLKTPPFNPADLTIPGFTFNTVSEPPTVFPFPRRVFPRSSTKEVKN